MEEDVAAAASAGLAAGWPFCWSLRRRVTFLRLRTSFAGHLRNLPQEVWLPPSPPTFGGLIGPWAEERHSVLPLVLQTFRKRVRGSPGPGFSSLSSCGEDGDSSRGLGFGSA